MVLATLQEVKKVPVDIRRLHGTHCFILIYSREKEESTYSEINAYLAHTRLSLQV